MESLETTFMPENVTTAGFNSTTGLLLWHRHAIGISLAISGNIMISLALSVQKYAHNRLGDDGKYYLNLYWWIGMLMMVLGEAGNFVAYGFAPASLVAPLGSVAVLSNVILAFIFLKEAILPQSIIGISLVIIGSIALISFSAAGNPSLTAETLVQYLKAWTFIVYIGAEAIILAILFYLNIFRKMEQMVILLLIVAFVASATIIAAKGVSSLLSISIVKGIKVILTPVFWVMLVVLPVSTAVQIRYLNRAMQLYNVSDVVPVNFIFFTVSAIFAGSVFYQEFYGVPFLTIFMFLFGCVLSFLGVFIISNCKEDMEYNCCKTKKSEDLLELTANEQPVGAYSAIEGSTYTSETENERRSVIISNLTNFIKKSETIKKVQPELK